ncbi:MAG: nucleotidyltransferase domain-containing protein [Nitrospirae bacterium]|nr:nucleotidyltransferase domain-containing protein [Nitrospirota bacterium]
MNRFAEYIEGWKEKERFLEIKLLSMQEEIWKLLPAVTKRLQSLGAKKVIVFGSLIEGGFKLNSDIDIAVAGLPAGKYIDAVIETEKILATAYVDFDLVLYEKAHTWIKEKINKGRVL